MNFRRSANRLPQFQRDQYSNYEVSKNQREQERRHRRGNSSERDIKENVEADEPIAQVMEKVHHGELATADCGLRNASITCSVRARRLPLIRTRSPGSARSVNNSAASAVDATVELFSRPARFAASAIVAATFPMAIKRSTFNAAAVSPTSRCPLSNSSPNSRISPNTAIRCPSASSSTKVRNAAFMESGFAL